MGAELQSGNWDRGLGLTWSGKWHVFEETPGPEKHCARALCGAYPYTRGRIPEYVKRLQRISAGYAEAPLCKKCDRAQRMK